MSEYMPLIPLLVAFALLGNVILGKYRRSREKPSPFVAGICRSMRERAHLWDYDGNENWLLSEDAHIAVCLTVPHFGQCDSYRAANSGSHLIMTFRGADEREFRKALDDWRELTAIDRQHVIERRKREALSVLNPV